MLDVNPTLNIKMISIPVDQTNPGHVFACVGLTELAYRLTGEATGYFDKLSYSLTLGKNWKLAELINEIQHFEIEPTDSSNKDSPISLGDFRLDWWLRDSAKSKAGNLKTWAGNMKISAILTSTKERLDKSENLLFDRPTACLTGKKKPPALTSLDAQRSKSTIDTGYSPDKLNYAAVPAPSVEFLAIIGLQRVWPTIINRSYRYYTWSTPIPVDLIPVAFVGHLETDSAFTFRIAEDGKCSRVLPAQPINTNN